MNQFPHDNIKPFESAGEKKQQVSEMFDQIAPRYDFMNRFLSVGIDVSWRIKAIKRFKKDNPKHLLDVATGTGDMAIRACKMLPVQKVTGIDISENMLSYGRQKVTKEGLVDRIELLSGDSEYIRFDGNTFDGVMVAFGVRNFQNLEKGLGEIYRVLKPGARLIVLEFSQPRIPGVRNLYNLYMGIIAPQMAKLFRQNKKAYQYLNESAKAFPDRGRFVSILKELGFAETSFTPLSLGICCIYMGKKPA
ncbi:bifunctional demethylmenaquinone methyltransferase/2-methoxy-6-polyprenyl-1,4-benzoquinol methylase UbiE [Flavisolibacter tropicus]|uniref:Demethylmenaquinone methyltransferase n=1 Tax=Flavisolibacter tropicus TaxID=1492898 RepID=A0A172TUL6_9BACT|nr:bifunctional demethylmenaquinone methyltransferase/2-methoxy-6-polyprenyl-1,4-benzoquinol methylase UbiE [Flavisolibacter tropicus]ANE50574.1 ubiquinone biosynthesis methyltransferase UbiE [Flavisolibacter tropicus]